VPKVQRREHKLIDYTAQNVARDLCTPGLGEERTLRDLSVVGKMVFEKGKLVLAHGMMVHVGREV
jgi:hypothetical protein